MTIDNQSVFPREIDRLGQACSGSGAVEGPVPLISVVMPVYNYARYVAQAVESILAQTFTDFEFLIIDDGSTDRSLAILNRYAGRDPRIRLVSRPNTGLVAALNEGLGLARGELIARMDADDVALPQRFEIQAAYLRAHPAVVCVGGQIMKIDAAGRDLYPCHEGMDHEAIQDLALTGSCPLAHASVMMRRAAVLAVGGYREEFTHAEDIDLWLRLGEGAGRMANLPQVILKYRIHDKSVSEVRQYQQLERSRVASDQACARRGIPPQFVERPPWRPTTRASRLGFFYHCGWLGFNRGDRRMALEYGLKSVGLMPWRSGGWWLLFYALVKPMPRSQAPAESTQAAGTCS